LASRSKLAVPYSSIPKTRIALLEIDEIEQCFRRVRLAAIQLGRENDIDAFASRVSAIRERLHTAETSKSEIDVMLATLKDDVQSFLRTLQNPH